MKTIISFLILILSFNAYAGRYNFPDFVKRNGGFGIDYKYMRASTTGYFALSSGSTGTCDYITPELQSAVVTTIARIAKAPDGLTWDIDSKGDCTNLFTTGAASDNLKLIDINNLSNIRHLSSFSFSTYVALNDLNPIGVRNFSFNGKAYTRYTVKPIIGELYDASSSGGNFVCVVEKKDFMETMIKSLSFNREKKGIFYHMWSDSRRLVNNEPYCDYAFIEIALWRMLD